MAAALPVALAGVVVAVGAVLAATALQRSAPTPAVASSPTPTAPSSRPEQTAVPTTGPLLPVHVYFARRDLPPTDAILNMAGVVSDRAEGRILRRIGALQSNVRASDVPPGATNPLALIRGRTQPTSSGTTQTFLGTSVRVDGDLATVEFELGDWGVRSLDEARALVQQLVYTITDESSVRRAKVIEKGKDHAVILAGGMADGYTWKDALTREDVFGYTHTMATGSTFTSPGTRDAALTLSTAYSIDQVAPGLLRFVINVGGVPAQQLPEFTVNAYGIKTQMPGAKAELEITIPGGEDTTTQAATVDRTPLRSIAVGSPVTFRAKVYRLGLDDLRPWRAVVLFDPLRIVIDVGGPPLGISNDDNTEVYAPAANAEVARTFTVSGVVRAFEATFAWRIRDGGGNIVIRGFGKANIGTSPVWGGYGFPIELPSTVSGPLTLEVFQGSPRDGSEVSVVKLPVRIRSG